MGINPHVELMPTHFPIRFVSFDDAVEELSPEFNVGKDSQKEILAGFLEHILVPEEESFVLPHFYMAVKAWWNVADQV